LLTDRQTDRQTNNDENISSLAEVKTSMLMHLAQQWNAIHWLPVKLTWKSIPQTHCR